MLNELLQTKLVAPPLRPFLVARPQLIAKLNQAITQGNQLILISAPPGYGKTTLVTHWLAQMTNGRFAWVSLDEEDNDLAHFLAYFMAAIQQVYPDYQPPEQSPQPEIAFAKAALTPILNQLQQMDQPAVLVLDDYHHITNPQIHALTSYFLEQSPPHMHLVLTVRADPPLPLARWRVRGQLAELRETHLRFSTEETAVFLQQFTQLDISADIIATLSEQTQGWVAGLQLAALALQTQEPFTFMGTDETLPLIADYLLAEVFLRQSADIQTFLLYTAVPDRLCADLCAVLVDGTTQSAAELLHQVVAANLFLTPLDGRAHWFRYHPIFRQFLLERLQEQSAEMAVALHRRTADWMVAQGFADTAVVHYLEAGAKEAAARQMAQIINRRLQLGEFDTISRWLSQLPDHLVWAEPQLALARLWLFASTGQPEALVQQAEQIENLAELPQAAETYALLAVAAAMRNQPAASLAYAQQAENLGTDGDAKAQATIVFALAAAYKTSQAFPEATTAFLRTEQLALQAGLTNMQFSAIANLGDMQFELGELHAARRSYEQALALSWPDDLIPPVLGWMHWSMGRLAYEWDKLDAAQTAAEQSAPLCAEWGHLGMMTRAQILLADLARVRGALTTAQSILDYAEQLAQQSGDGRFSSTVTYQRLILALQQNDIHAIRYWASRLQAQADAPPMTQQVALARLALAEQQPDAALTHLQAAEAAFAQLKYVPGLVKIALLTAVAQQQAGKMKQARAAWQQAITLAQPGGFVRTFVDEGVPVLRLLQADTAVTPYHAQLLSAFSPEADDSLDLTKRETQILHLLAAGLSNQEIAQQLVIAESTAKRHVSNLYTKLNVHSRTQAITRATELHLLP